MVEAQKRAPLSNSPSELAKNEVHRPTTAIKQGSLSSGIRQSIARIAEDHELDGSLVKPFEGKSYLLHPFSLRKPTSEFPYIVEYQHTSYEVETENGKGHRTEWNIVILGVKKASKEVLEAIQS